MIKISVIVLVLILSACASTPIKAKDSMGIGWGYIERIDYDNQTTG